MENEPNTVQKFPFTKYFGMKVNIVGSEPINVFKPFLTQELISIMVNKTNKYAGQETSTKTKLTFL